MERKRVRYLVRRLTIRNSGGEDRVFSLAVLSGCRHGNRLEEVSVGTFERESAGTEYIPALSLTASLEGDFFIVEESQK